MIGNTITLRVSPIAEKTKRVLSPFTLDNCSENVLASDAEGGRSAMPLEMVNYNLYRDPETGYQFEWDTREVPGKVQLVLYLEPRMPILKAVMEDSWRSGESREIELSRRVLTGSKRQIRESFLGYIQFHAKYKHHLPGWLTESSLDELLRIATNGWTELLRQSDTPVSVSSTLQICIQFSDG